MDGLCERGLFLGAACAHHRLHAGPAGVPYAGIHRRLLGAGGAGARDFQNRLITGRDGFSGAPWALLAHDLRANASRLLRGRTVTHFSAVLWRKRHKNNEWSTAISPAKGETSC